LFLSAISFVSTLGQQVSISGLAKDFAGGQVVLFNITDPISNKREVLSVKNIDSNGSFSLSLSINETQSVLVSIARMEGLLYVEPNHHYDIVFPPTINAEVKRFDRTEATLDLSNLPEDDLNLIIRSFNADYISFISQHYYDFVSDEFKGSDLYRSTLGNKVRKSDMYKMPSANDSISDETVSDFPSVAASFFKEMDTKYQRYYSNAYFKNYVRYALAEIKLLSGLNRKKFYQEFLHGQPTLYRNNAYMKTFETFYKGFFKTDTNAKRDSLSKLINSVSNFQRLSSYYRSDSTALDADLRMMAVLLNLKTAYHDKQYSRAAVIKTLGTIATIDATAFQKEISSGLVSQLKRYDKGYVYEDFVVGDARDEKWILSDHLGVETYLFFFATWNAASVKEMLVLEKLYTSYKNDVQIIAICMDDDYNSFKKYLKEHKNQQFKMLYGTGDALMSDKYNVRSIPHAVFLDKEGKWMFSHTRLPSEGVEDDFKRIKINNAKPSEGRKTWKDK